MAMSSTTTTVHSTKELFIFSLPHSSQSLSYLANSMLQDKSPCSPVVSPQQTQSRCLGIAQVIWKDGSCPRNVRHTLKEMPGKECISGCVDIHLLVFNEGVGLGHCLTDFLYRRCSFEHPWVGVSWVCMQGYPVTAQPPRPTVISKPARWQTHLEMEEEETLWHC